MTFEDIERHIKLVACCVKRHCAHETHEAVSQSCGLRNPWCIGAQNLRRAGDHCRGRTHEIGLKRRHVCKRVVVKIEAARVDQRDEPIGSEAITLDRRQQRRRDRIGRCLPVTLTTEDIAPPLQANLAGNRFPRHLAHARDLDVECVERK